MDFFFDRSIAGEGKIPTRVDGYPAVDRVCLEGVEEAKGVASKREKERESEPRRCGD